MVALDGLQTIMRAFFGTARVLASTVGIMHGRLKHPERGILSASGRTTLQSNLPLCTGTT